MLNTTSKSAFSLHFVGWLALIGLLGRAGLAAESPAGLAEAGGPGLEERRLVALPPCFTTESAWRYAQVGDAEVLSQCSDALTRQVLDYQHVVQEELALILPKSLQVRRPVPAVYVLFNDPPAAAVGEQMAARISQFASMPLETDPEDPIEAEAAQAARAAIKWEVRFMPSGRLWDADSFARYFLLHPDSAAAADLTLTADHLRYLLEARTPAVPFWFIEGMVELYAHSVRLSAPPLGVGSGAKGVQATGVTIEPMHWLSAGEIQALRKNPGLVPLATVFGGPRVGAGQAAELRQRRIVGALFIRWALDQTKPESQTGRPAEALDLDRLEPRYLEPRALWEFVERAGREPVNEALFQACFGQTYAEAEARLRDYVPYALAHPIELKPAEAPRAPPEFALRAATVAEVGRLRGDLARLEIATIKDLYPQLTMNYREQIRAVTSPSLTQGERDPRLLAVVGLAECDTNNDEAARPWLEAAVAAKLPRARIYHELARIRFNEIRPAKPDEKLPIAKVSPVLALLATGLEQAPPLPETYELIAEIWLRTAGRLSREQLAMLDEGLRYFPTRVRLVYSTALLYAFAGLDGRARELVEQGLAHCVDEGEKSRLLKLWSAIHEDAVNAGETLNVPTGRAAPRWSGPKLKPEIVPRALQEKEEPVIQLKAFKVSEVFPPINVRFNLRGENLFNTLDDPIIDAYVTYVKSDGLGARLGIQVGDVLLALNGAELKGRTIREVAALVEAARQGGDMVWAIRRGTAVLTLRHKGKWEIPLPAAGK